MKTSSIRLFFLPNTVAQVVSYYALVRTLQEIAASGNLNYKFICADNDPRGREAETYCLQENLPYIRLGRTWQEKELKSGPYVQMMAVRQKAEAEIKEALEEFQPDVVVIPYDVEGAPAILMQQAALRGIPVLLLQDSLHGLEPVPISPDGKPGLGWPRFYPGGSCHYGHGGATRIAVCGTRLQQKMVQEGIPAANLVVTGQPRWDPLTKEFGTAQQRSPNLHAPHILYVSSPWRNPQISDPQVAQFVLEETKKLFATALVTVKLHPVENLADYAFLSERYGAKDGVRITQEAETAHLIKAADVVVMVQSTVGLEAMAAAKPLIRLACFFPGAKMDIYEGVTGFLNVDRPADYAQTLQSALFDQESRKRLQAEQAYEVKRHMHIPDGQAARRVAQLIMAMATEPNYKEETAVSVASAMPLYQSAMTAYYENRLEDGKRLLAQAITQDPYLIAPPERLLFFLREQYYLWANGWLDNLDLSQKVVNLYHNLPDIDGILPAHKQHALADFYLRQAVAFRQNNPATSRRLLARAVKFNPQSWLDQRYWITLVKGLVGV